MANSLLKLTVESSEYDAKLKKAAEGIRHLADVAHEGDGSLVGLEESTLDYIKAVGEMETKSRSAAGQVRELESTYKELKVIYDQFNEMEKADEGGKALAASLEQLKQRAQDAKKSLDDASKSLQANSDAGKEDSSVLDLLASKFTINIDAVKLFNIGLQATKMALDVAKDAFFNNEENLDAWGRTVEASESLYKGFLNSLNTGDISGYLQNIDNIVKAAQDAYNALDNLATFNAFNQINVERTRTGMTESIASFREGTGSKDSVKAAGEAYKKELQQRKKMENEAYLAAVGKVASERGVSKKDLLSALSGSYGSYESLKNLPLSGTKTVYAGLGMYAGGGTSYKVATAANEREKLGEALRHLNDTELQSLQALGAQAQRTGNEIAQVDKQMARVLNAKEGGSGSGGGGRSGGKTSVQQQTEYQQNQKKINDLIQQYVALNASGAADIEKQNEALREQIKELEDRNGKLKLYEANARGLLLAPDTKMPEHVAGIGMPLDTKKFTGLSDKAQKALSNQISKQLKNFIKENGKGEDKSFVEVADQIYGGVSQMVSSLEQLGIDIPEGFKSVLGEISGVIGVLQALITVVEGAKAIQGIGSFLGSIFKLAGGGVVHAETGYIVPGNRFSGDNIPALLNSGETVLTRSQAGVLANALSGNSMQNLRLEAVVTGEQIRFALNNNGRRTGRGEYVQTNRR